METNFVGWIGHKSIPNECSHNPFQTNLIAFITCEVQTTWLMGNYKCMILYLKDKECDYDIFI